MIKTLLLLSFCTSLSFSFQLPSEIYIGGIFSPFNENGTVNHGIAQSLTAFQMAIEEINQNDELLPQITLRSKISSGQSFEGSVKASDYLTTSPHVSAIIGSQKDEEAMGSNLFFNDHNIVQFQTLASSSQFGDSEVFKYLIQSIALKSFDGSALQRILCETFNQHRISLFTSSDDESVDIAIEFQSQRYCSLTSLSSHSFRSNTRDFSHYLSIAKHSGSKIFVLFMPSSTATRLLIQGYQSGLFNQEGIQIYGDERVTQPETFLRMDPQVARAVMKGYLGIKYYPSFAMRVEGSHAREFVSKFQSLPATKIPVPNHSGYVYCDNTTDSLGAFYLYRSPLLNSKTSTSSTTTTTTTIVSTFGPDIEMNRYDPMDPSNLPYINLTSREDSTWESTPIPESLCAGMNYSEDFINPDGSDIYPSVPHVYDSVYTLAIALHDILFSSHSILSSHPIFSNLLSFDDIQGKLLQEYIIENVSFQGATGEVSFEPGLFEQNYYGKGSRKTGYTYGLYNFNQERFDFSPEDALVLVGFWQDTSDSVIWCADQDHVLKAFGSNNNHPDECIYSIIYNTPDNQIPRDSPNEIHLKMDLGSGAALIVCCLLSSLFVIYFTGITIYYYKTKLIKASQPKMLFVILFGAFLGSLRVGFGAAHPDNNICSIHIWTGHLSFIITFSAMLVKTWRVHKILNNQTLKRIKITETEVLVYMGIIALCSCIYLTFLQIFGEPNVSSFHTLISNQKTYYYECHLHFPQFETALFSFEGGLLLIGARLCWLVKNVPDAVNESPYIASAMLVIILVSCMIFPIEFVILGPKDGVIRQLLTSFGFGLALISVVSLVFAPKTLCLLNGNDIEGIGKKPIMDRVFPGGVTPGTKMNDGAPKPLQRANSTLHGSTMPTTATSSSSASSSSSSESEVLFTVENLLRSAHGEAVKLKMCRDYLAAWQFSMMRIQQLSSETGSGSNSQSHQHLESEIEIAKNPPPPPPLQESQQLTPSIVNTPNENNDNNNNNNNNNIPLFEQEKQTAFENNNNKNNNLSSTSSSSKPSISTSISFGTFFKSEKKSESQSSQHHVLELENVEEIN